MPCPTCPPSVSKACRASNCQSGWACTRQQARPKPAIERIQRELKAVVAEPDIVRRMLDQGQAPIANTPDEFIASFRVDFPKWEALIRASGAKAD